MAPMGLGTTAPRHRLHVSVPDETYQRLRQQAHERRTTISALVNAALSLPAAPAHVPAPAPPPFVPDAEPSTSGGIVGRALERHR